MKVKVVCGDSIQAFFGYFDGKNLDSAVMIRFIEQDGNSFFFHSGGGVTINSRCEDEYREVLEKVYLSVK